MSCPAPELDPAATPASDDGAEPLKVVLIEQQDPDGRRWQAALTLLLEAGREALTRSG